MRRVMTAYVMYFNNRYQRVGGLFQGRYKASQITTDAYLQHISRYIHLNPKDYKGWPYSSYGYYSGDKVSSWVKPEPILAIFDDNRQQYIAFVAKYIDTRKELSTLKHQLANYDK